MRVNGRASAWALLALSALAMSQAGVASSSLPGR
jgi:hypothetical protein